jgi:cupin 2 domain-containing protein
MTIRVQNIFADLPNASSQEHFVTLLENSAVKIQRIVSDIDSGSSELWYDQDHEEWVIVLRGNAILEFEGGELTKLKAGDCLMIPSHIKHRVEYTDPQTVWLVVHAKNTKPAQGGADDAT